MTTTQTSTGYSGLTARQIVTQSFLCHPDWSADTHLEYLYTEEGVTGVSYTDIVAWIRMAAAAQRTEAARRQPRPRNSRPQGGTRTNRYAGTCQVCGEHVPANQGVLVGQPGAWAVEHADPEACQAAEDEAETVPATPPPARYLVAAGEFHLVEGVLYRVQKARGTDNLYAKQATIIETSEGHHANISWEYAGKTPFRLFTAETLLTWEQAREIGTLTHTCIRCSATLGGEHDEAEIRSVAAGYGETCAGRMGWPYPTLDEARAILAERTRR